MKVTSLRILGANVSRTNFVFVKFHMDEGMDGVGEATPEWKRLAFENGHLLAPSGLGVELNEEACARFPYAPHDVTLFDGSIDLSGVATGAAVMNETQH